MNMAGLCFSVKLFTNSHGKGIRITIYSTCGRCRLHLVFELRGWRYQENWGLTTALVLPFENRKGGILWFLG